MPEANEPVFTLSASDLVDRKKRLWKLGFNCFAVAEAVNPAQDPGALDQELEQKFRADTSIEDWVYATLEFQLYSKWSPRLGVIAGGRLVPSDGTVRAALDAALVDVSPNGRWDAVWDDCLAIWEAAAGTSPPSDADRRGYRCPVVIERLSGLDTNVHYWEGSDLEQATADRANVWQMRRADAGKLFSARDVSGWFAVQANDDAYVADPTTHRRPYVRPTGIDGADWLHKRRIAMRASLVESQGWIGPTIIPWEAAELRPKVLGNVDAARIRTSTRWGGIYRIVRAVGQVESLGYFDVIQGYDDAFLSLPLFHYAAPQHTDTPGGTQLGGVSVWLNSKNAPAQSRHSLAKLGLRASEEWIDHRGIGQEYETGSGEDLCGSQSAIATLLAPAEGLSYRKSLDLLRRPHMVYRHAMHLRTLSASRQALWRYAVHLLRQLVWLRIPDDKLNPEPWRNQPLGQVVKSERALALILRIAVKSPGSVVTNFKKSREVFAAASSPKGKDALLRWMRVAWDHAQGDAARFEQQLIALLDGTQAYAGTTIPALAEVDPVTLRSVSRWPASVVASATFHLDASEIKGGLAPLSSLPGSSPFIQDKNGQHVFSDALDAWWQPDAGHPSPAHAPGYSTSPLLREKARVLGIAPALPQGAWPATLAAAVDAQTSREIQAAAACGYARSDGDQIVQTAHGHELRCHGVFNQRWSRLHLHDFYAQKRSSVLVCGPLGGGRPTAMNAVWQLSEVPNKTIVASDARANGAWKEYRIGKFDPALRQVASEDDEVDVGSGAALGLPNTPLAQKTLDVFKRAVSEGATGVPKADSFAIELGAKDVKVRMGWLRQQLKYGDATAPAGELGLFLELLAWRSRGSAASDVTRRFLAQTGFDFRNRSSDDIFFSFGGAASLDPCAPWLRTLLWKPGKDFSPASADELALACLTWPALHRWRLLLRQSAAARCAMWDVWRLQMREVLRLPASGLGLAGEGRLFDLFQAQASLTAIATWAQADLKSLQLAWRSREFRSGMRAWVQAGALRKDVAKWSGGDECEVLWDLLIPRLPAGALKQRLQGLRPTNPPARVYEPALDQVIFLNDLEGTEWPGTKVPGTTSGFLVAPAGASSFGLALLVQELPPAIPVVAALAAGAGGAAAPHPVATAGPVSHWVTGIAPVFRDTTNRHIAAALTLPAPVEVRIDAQASTQAVDLFAAAGTSAETLDLATVSSTSAFEIEVDIAPWLGELGAGNRVWLIVKGRADSGGVFIEAGLRVEMPWLRMPLVYPCRPIADIKDVRFDIATRSIKWRLAAPKPNPDPDLDPNLGAALPLRASFSGEISLTLGLDASEQPFARFLAQMSGLDIQLGSPVASLGLMAPPGESFELQADLLQSTASLRTPASLQALLRLELCALDGGVARVVSTWNESRSGQGSPAGDLSAPITIDLGTIAVPQTGLAVASDIEFANALTRVPAWLLPSAGFAARPVGRFQLLDVASQWFSGAGLQLTVELADAPVRKESPTSIGLELPLRFALSRGAEPGFGAVVKVLASCAVQNGYLDLSATSFACNIASVDLTMKVPDGARELNLGVAKLAWPQELHAKLDLTGSSPNALVFEDLKKSPITLTFPADGGFDFDLTRLELGSAGASLKASVRKGQAILSGIKTLTPQVNVREASDELGSLVIERGRLVSATIEADARLNFFDDAEGLLRVTLFQDAADGQIGALAEFKVPVGRTFHVRALYMRAQVDSIQLSLKYKGGQWSASGGMTGSLAFAPDGALESRLSEYKELFDGTKVHFENLDLGNLGNATIRVEVTPRTFEVAEIFSVTWRGFEIRAPGVNGISLKSVGLLGDITFKAELPNLKTELSLGDIGVWQASAEALVPRIKISSIGISVALASSFRFKGRLREYDDDKEFGFAGVAYLESETFPGTMVLLKLTRVRDDKGVGNPEPSCVAYVDTDREDSLGYGFFLRKVGLAVAVNQGLVGFSDAEARSKPLSQRVDQALVNGIRYPGAELSWQPVYPHGGTAYSLVAFAQVSFGLLDRRVDHPFMTTLVLSIDNRLDIIAGINGWFIASPDAVLTDEFTSRPALRGAIGLSPREQVLYGRFMTLPNSKFGPSAEGNAVGALLKKALDSSRLSAAFYSDPRGALLEIAYPRQARYEVSLGPARGVAESGFRIGYYRGTHVIGMNFAASAEIATGFSADFGFANVELSARASFQLQASFAGALTNGGQIYVLADLTLSALLEISIRLYKRLRISGFWGSFTITLFDIRESLRISASAALAVALTPDGIGFDGMAEVAISVAGFHLSARLRVAANEGRIGDARRQINALVPPISEITGRSATAAIGSAQPAAAGSQLPGALALPALAVQPVASSASMAVTPSQPVSFASADLLSGDPLPDRWCYHVRSVGNKTRVVLYPSADSRGYPALAANASGRSHTIVLQPNIGFTGIVGRAPVVPVGDRLTITEQATGIVIPASYVRMDSGASADVHAGALLEQIEAYQAVSMQEIVDPRTQYPVAGDFDDPAVLANPARRSTRFRKRLGVFGDGALTYDDHLLAAQLPAGQSIGSSQAITNAELLMSLFQLAESDSASAGAEEHPEIGSGSGARLNPLRLPSLLGLVLEFENPNLAQLLAEKGIQAIAQEIFMFGQSVDWSDPFQDRARLAFEPAFSQWFQGPGEIGLSWQLTRTEPDGTIARQGPPTHRGLRHFRVRRTELNGRVAPAEFTVTPSWICYRNGADRYAIRQQFQFLDSGLPIDRELQLRYEVDAIGPEGEKYDGGSLVRSQDGVLCREVFDFVHYQPARKQPNVIRSQCLLRLPQAPDAATLEIRVAVDVTEWIGRTRKEIETDLIPRIDLYCRPVRRGMHGTYGSGNELDVSLRWRKALNETALRLPEPVQSRRMGRDALQDAIPVPAALRWVSELVDHGEAGSKATRLIIFKSKLVFASGKEDQAWASLGMTAGVEAAEFYVRLKDFTDASGAVALATPLERCRIALAEDKLAYGAVKTGAVTVKEASEQVACDARFSEGREVAALERFDVNAGQRAREWLAVEDFVVAPEVLGSEGAEGGSLNEFGLRLVGRIRHAPTVVGPSANPVVGYRVWTRDTLDDISESASPKPLAITRSFSVLPEAVFRALPQSIVVKAVARKGEAQPVPTWQSESKRLSLADVPSLPQGARREPFDSLLSGATLAGGDEAVVHADILRFASSSDWAKSNRTVKLAVDEPLIPPQVGSTQDRSVPLLQRYPEEADWLGWRLLEAVGGIATLWVESDDDRVALEEWLPSKNLQESGVAIISFSKLSPADRVLDRQPPYLDQRWSLYAVRVLALDMLLPLARLATSKTREEDERALLVVDTQKVGSALGHALDWLVPEAAATEQGYALREAFLRTLTDRIAKFAVIGRDSDADPSNRLHLKMWDRSPSSKTGPAPVVDAAPNVEPVQALSCQAPSVLPLVGNGVDFVHGLEVGYARDLQVAIEVLRRYDFHPSNEFTGQPAPTELTVRRVEVPRTLDLGRETATTYVGEDGSVNALVQVHAAQRAHLYEASLSRRVQFDRQEVTLHRDLSPDIKAQATWLFARLREDLDWDALAATWASDGMSGAKASVAWTSTVATPDDVAQAVRRGFNRIRFPLVPATHQWWVSASTHAGIRVSDDVPALGHSPGSTAATGIESEETPVRVMPMFPLSGKRQDGLAYLNPAFAWQLGEKTLEVSFPFARAIDSLPDELKDYWSGCDERWAPPVAGAVEIPALHLPDLKAEYVILATKASCQMTVDLARIHWEAQSGQGTSLETSGELKHELLVRPYRDLEVVQRQFKEGGDLSAAWLGQTGLTCRLPATSPELAWLVDSLRSGDGQWRLGVRLLRDGAKFES